jgi:rubrerythrin
MFILTVKITLMHQSTAPLHKHSQQSENKLTHPQLRRLLQKAYSAEKAASYAYQGHAASVKSSIEKIAIKQIEDDEWNHRREVLNIMQYYNIPVNR